MYTEESTNPTTGTWVGAASIYHCSQGALQANLVMPSPAGRSGDSTKKAELHDILLGLHSPEALNVSDKRLILYTDSQSAIRAIQRHRSTCSPTIDKIYQTANRLTKENNQFDIRWVPAHSGIPGNEAAHETAACKVRKISSSPSTSTQSSHHATRPSD